jgi:hypothetical protein
MENHPGPLQRVNEWGNENTGLIAVLGVVAGLLYLWRR